MLVPHDPYDLDRECRPTTAHARYGSEGYFASVSCLTHRLLPLMQSIPEHDIVLVIGDHGSDLYTNDVSDLTASELADRTSAFIAVRGCDLARSHLTSNVNAYRGVAQCVLGQSIPAWPAVPHLACYEASPDLKLVPALEALAQGRGMSCNDS